MRESSQTVRGKAFRMYDFEGPAAVMRWLDDPKNKRYVSEQPVYWAGDSFGAARDVITGRKPSPNLPQVGALIDKIDSAFRDREKLAFEPAIAGAYPIVPEFLIGTPECMRRRMPVEDDKAPIRLYVSQWVMNNVDTDVMVKRGTAIAALAMRLAEERPVELYAILEADDEGCGHCAVYAYPICTAPINATEVAANFATPFVVRQVLYNLTNVPHKQLCMGTYPMVDVANRDACEKLMREVLRLSPADLYFPPLYGSSAEQHPYLTDPVGWVNKLLEQQRKLHD